MIINYSIVYQIWSANVIMKIKYFTLQYTCISICILWSAVCKKKPETTIIVSVLDTRFNPPIYFFIYAKGCLLRHWDITLVEQTSLNNFHESSCSKQFAKKKNVKQLVANHILESAECIIHLLNTWRS